MALSLLMALHVTGVLLWIGGLYAALSVMTVRARRAHPDADAALIRLERGFLLKACHPGMLLAVLSGAGLIAFNPGYFLKEGWLQAKLLLAAGLVVLTALATVWRRRWGSSPPARALKAQRRLAAAGAFLILLLVFLRPF